MTCLRHVLEEVWGIAIPLMERRSFCNAAVGRAQQGLGKRPAASASEVMDAQKLIL